MTTKGQLLVTTQECLLVTTKGLLATTKGRFLVTTKGPLSALAPSCLYPRHRAGPLWVHVWLTFFGVVLDIREEFQQLLGTLD